jgi:hypothetical protein
MFTHMGSATTDIIRTRADFYVATVTAMYSLDYMRNTNQNTRNNPRVCAYIAANVVAFLDAVNTFQVRSLFLRIRTHTHTHTYIYIFTHTGNDAYSAIKVASALADVNKCGVNDLVRPPSSLLVHSPTHLLFLILSFLLSSPAARLRH